MNSETYKKIHEQQVARLKAECERMVAEGAIVEERFNAEWIEDCDKYIASRCRDMARNGLAQVLDEAVHQMAADYFNDELHGKWKGMKFEGLGDCKNEVEEDLRKFSENEESERTKVLETELANRNGELNLLREESLDKSKKLANLAKDLKEARKDLKSAQKDAEKARKEAEKARKEAEKARMAVEKAKPRETKASPEPVVDYDQIDMFAMAVV